MVAIIAGAIFFTSTGCSTALNQQGNIEPSPTYQVVDEREVAESPYACEYPAIQSTVNFQDGTVTPLSTTNVSVSRKSTQEVRAVWISYLEMNTMLKGKSKSQFEKNISAAFDNISAYGLNTVIVQVRPFADALYDSDYFPWSHTITGTEGVDPGFDPLEIMVEEAKARGLRIEAWINPYRIRANGNTNELSSDNMATKWKKSQNGAVITYNGVTSYNPASKTARDLIVNGAVEIVEKYGVDGIHIDDYFYPSSDEKFDKASYTAYKNSGGTLNLQDWRRSNVEKLLRSMYSAIKEADEDAVFGISPQSSVYNNYNVQYLDVEKIASRSGYCDYICPQIYFGYNNAAQPYKETLDQWSKIVEGSPVKLYIGVAGYKIGTADSWAGNSGKTEWQKNTDLMSRMVTDARDSSNYKGFVLYRYDSIFRPESGVKKSVEKENKNLKKIL